MRRPKSPTWLRPARGSIGSGFELLPPEITSAQIYAGPGSGSYMAAAAAWNGVAAEMSSGGLGLNQVIPELSGEEWLGPASAAMAAAVQPYLEWMTTTATQAEEAAAQAQSAAAAYETVLGSITPPPAIAVNRGGLAQAMATNVLGQNNNVISQLEAQYQEFWATNTAAMFNYANQSAAAANVTAFKNAPTVANPAAATTQAAANTSTSAASIQQTLQKYLTEIQTAIGHLST